MCALVCCTYMYVSLPLRTKLSKYCAYIFVSMSACQQTVWSSQLVCVCMTYGDICVPASSARVS